MCEFMQGKSEYESNKCWYKVSEVHYNIVPQTGYGAEGSWALTYQIKSDIIA